MSANDKRKQLEEKQRRWMQQREQEVNGCASSSTPAAPPPPHAPYAAGTAAGSYSTSSSSSFSSGALTSSSNGDANDQLTRRIREEIARELRNNASFQQPHQQQPTDRFGTTHKQRLEEFMAHTEAAVQQTHTCQVCFEMMLSPRRTPMFLYPCGHTFCRECMNKHTEGATKPTCPLCRTVIQSVVPNQALRDLVEQYADKRRGLEGSQQQQQQQQQLPPIGSSHGQRQQNQQQQQYNNSNHNDSRRSSVELDNFDESRRRLMQEETEQRRQQRRHYEEVLSSCEVRQAVLQQELADRRKSLEGRRRKQQSLLAADTHLRSEKSGLEQRIAQLQEELALLETHLAQQGGKQAEVAAGVQEDEAAVALLEETLRGLGREREKAAVLLSDCCD